jgi:hypothetical protein
MIHVDQIWRQKEFQLIRHGNLQSLIGDFLRNKFLFYTDKCISNDSELTPNANTEDIMKLRIKGIKVVKRKWLPYSIFSRDKESESMV